MKPRKKRTVIFSVIIILLVTYLVCIIIPMKKNYEFSEKLDLKYYNTTICNEENPIFGESVDVKIHFSSISIYNTYYDEGIVIINGIKYRVKNNRYYPRSFIARCKNDLKYMTEVIKYKYDVFGFHITDEAGYLIVITGRENGSNIHIQIKKDDILCYSYEK